VQAQVCDWRMKTRLLAGVSELLSFLVSPYR
jgi:hypothetical protein